MPYDLKKQSVPPTADEDDAVPVGAQDGSVIAESRSWRTPRSGDERTNSLVASGDIETGGNGTMQAFQRGKQAPLGSSANIALVLKSCREAVERALESRDDLIDRANALNDLRDALQDLWRYHEQREEQFADLINHLQGLLIDVEDLPMEQIEAIGQVIEKASYASCLTDPDLREYTRILMRAGCDVFREIR